jgi:hypothetical protein
VFKALCIYSAAFPFLFLRRIPSIPNEEFSDLREVVIVSSLSFPFSSDKSFKTSNLNIYDIYRFGDVFK